MKTRLYAPTHRATLRRAEAKIGQAGLAIRSGWARAPMVGGQSWLTHGSVASGLWLDTQSRYRGASGQPAPHFVSLCRAGRAPDRGKSCLRMCCHGRREDYFGFDCDL